MSILSRLRRLLIVKRKPSLSSSAIADLHLENSFLRCRAEQLFKRARDAERRADIAESLLARFHTKRDARGRYTKGDA